MSSAPASPTMPIMSMQIAGGDMVGPFEGRDNIMELYRGAKSSQTDVRRHDITNIMFDASGDTLAVTSYLTLFATENAETKLFTTGVYRDQVASNRTVSGKSPNATSISTAPTEGITMNLGRIPAKTALLDPEREALIDIPNDRRMTFGALDERIRRLANGILR